MMNSPSYLEDRISQVPALLLLANLGWEYVSPVEALALRVSRGDGRQKGGELQ